MNNVMEDRYKCNISVNLGKGWMERWGRGRIIEMVMRGVLIFVAIN